MPHLFIHVNTCKDCPYHSHNGNLQKDPKWVCAVTVEHGREKVICSKTEEPQVPEWCPFLFDAGIGEVQ